MSYFETGVAIPDIVLTPAAIGDLEQFAQLVHDHPVRDQLPESSAPGILIGCRQGDVITILAAVGSVGNPPGSRSMARQTYDVWQSHIDKWRASRAGADWIGVFRASPATDNLLASMDQNAASKVFQGGDFHSPYMIYIIAVPASERSETIRCYWIQKARLEAGGTFRHIEHRIIDEAAVTFENDANSSETASVRTDKYDGSDSLSNTVSSKRQFNSTSNDEDSLNGNDPRQLERDVEEVMRQFPETRWLLAYFETTLRIVMGNDITLSLDSSQSYPASAPRAVLHGTYDESAFSIDIPESKLSPWNPSTSTLMSVTLEIFHKIAEFLPEAHAQRPHGAEMLQQLTLDPTALQMPIDEPKQGITIDNIRDAASIDAATNWTPVPPADPTPVHQPEVPNQKNRQGSQGQQAEAQQPEDASYPPIRTRRGKSPNNSSPAKRPQRKLREVFRTTKDRLPGWIRRGVNHTVALASLLLLAAALLLWAMFSGRHEAQRTVAVITTQASMTTNSSHVLLCTVIASGPSGTNQFIPAESIANVFIVGSTFADQVSLNCPNIATVEAVMASMRETQLGHSLGSYGLTISGGKSHVFLTPSATSR